MTPDEGGQETGGERRASPAEAGGEAQRLLERLLAAIDVTRPVAIHTHDHPDPDSIASAAALQYLLEKKLEIEPVIVYGGTIGRAMNRLMIELLGIRMQHLWETDTEEYGTHILIDTQPETGNHSLPDDLPIAIAIDHHPLKPETAQADFSDIRTEYGATSTILYYYLRAAGLDLSTKLATALLIGIKSDTRGLERETSEADLQAYLEIFPRADLTLVARIENPRIPRQYFEAFHRALEMSTLYEGAIVADLGEVENSDMVAELADFFIPLEGTEYALVMGSLDGRLYLSLRTRDESHDAGAMISRIVGDLGTAGGHGRMAGAQVEIKDGEESQTVRRRFLDALGLEERNAGSALVRENDPSG